MLSAAEETQVRTIVPDRVARVPKETSLKAVADLLAANDIGVVVVGDENHVHGVVSERDLVRAIAAGRDMETTLAADVATTDLLWCDATATAAEVAEQMMEHYIRHILVERRGKLVGIVSVRDLLGVFVSDLDFET